MSTSWYHTFSFSHIQRLWLFIVGYVIAILFFSLLYYSHTDYNDVYVDNLECQGMFIDSVIYKFKSTFRAGGDIYVSDVCYNCSVFYGLLFFFTKSEKKNYLPFKHTCILLHKWDVNVTVFCDVFVSEIASEVVGKIIIKRKKRTGHWLLFWLFFFSLSYGQNIMDHEISLILFTEWDVFLYLCLWAGCFHISV